MGRKPFYDTPKQMEEAIEAYFDQCDKGVERDVIIYKRGKAVDVVSVVESTPYTMEDLTLALGFAATNALWAYAKKDTTPEGNNGVGFKEVISRARTRIGGHRLRECLLGHQDAKIGQLDLATHHGYQPKLELPEGATILIGVQGPSKPTEDGEKPALEAPAKAIAIID